jgi:cytochrome c oxidase subunit 5a
MTFAAGLLLRRLPTAARMAPLRRPQFAYAAAAAARATAFRPAAAAFSTGRRALSDDPHENETFEEFTARYENEFESVNDVFELQVGFPPPLSLYLYAGHG